MLRRKGLLFIFCPALLFSCAPENLPEALEVYPDLTVYDYAVGSNDALPALGRILFYDKQLSVNNSVSCASCHKQAFAFSDNEKFSRGFENRLTTRNSMPIQNLQAGFVSSPGLVFVSPQALFWDGREFQLSSLALRPIVNHVEMGINDLSLLEDKLRKVPYYPELFFNAFGSIEITSQKLADALAAFMANIQSNNTRFDKAIFEDIPLTSLEQQGMALFVEKYDCNSCHQVQNPLGYIAAGTFSNIGLDPVYADNGLGGVTRSANDNGRFKIPSLRNVMLTAPYMHDGRFTTLSEVIDHYSSGIANHPSLDFRLKDNGGSPMHMNITEGEKQAIIAFLNTLTDYSMITDPKLSDPFKIK